MATQYRQSMRFSFQSMLRSGRDRTNNRTMVIEVALKHKRTIFLRNQQGQIVDFYERNAGDSRISFPFVFDSLGLSFSDFRDQVCVRIPGLAPSLCTQLSQQIFLYAQRVSLTGQELNDDIMAAIMAHVEIEDSEVEEVYTESSVDDDDDDDDGVLSNFDDNNSIDEDEGDDELSSNLPRGLSSSEINGLKQEGFKSSGAEEESSCSICLEEFLVGVNVTPLPCAHTFHHSCIATWLEKQATCPLCRSHITQTFS